MIAAQDYASLRLLVVDDVAVHRQLMASGLQLINPFFSIDEAGSVRDAKAALTNGQRYHAVICDRAMPGGEGSELVRWMRSMRCFDRVPFVMISGHTAPEDIIQAFMEFEVDAYVPKPFTYDDLYAKTMAAIKKRAGAQALLRA